MPAHVLDVNYGTKDEKGFRVQSSLYYFWIIGTNPLSRVWDMSDLGLAQNLMFQNSLHFVAKLFIYGYFMHLKLQNVFVFHLAALMNKIY